MTTAVVVALVVVVGLVIGAMLGALEDEAARRRHAAVQAALSERDAANHRLAELRHKYDRALAESSNRKATGKGGPLETRMLDLPSTKQ